jgi:hypothetical protein
MGKTGDAATLLQNAAQAAGTRPFSSPAHPSLLHGMSVAAPMAIAMPVISGAARALELLVGTVCATSPAVSARARNITKRRRIFSANIGFDNND